MELHKRIKAWRHTLGLILHTLKGLDRFVKTLQTPANASAGVSNQLRNFGNPHPWCASRESRGTLAPPAAAARKPRSNHAISSIIPHHPDTDGLSQINCARTAAAVPRPWGRAGPQQLNVVFAAGPRCWPHA
jgi:hypothetical protein